ncbi:glycoside hydrolase [Microthyrium microscopicum]|uniref:glucan endo-1,3-beta-D-glucosidase n=1 Tax=Microthyrium microscopicum TaxID=703497 RepID=A0A6A6UQA1_9PEZI|nr:glycoside hydrolase [Microthyrium microscopicum]
MKGKWSCSFLGALPIFLLVVGDMTAEARNIRRNVTIGTGGTDSANEQACQKPVARETAIANIFKPIDNIAPRFATQQTHPFRVEGYHRNNVPIHTNKFYVNLLLDKQDKPVYCHPYTVAWTGCTKENAKENNCHYGMGVTQTDIGDVKYGPGEPAQYYFNPIDKHAIALSAKELGEDSQMTLENPTAFSVTAVLSSPANKKPIIKTNLVQGMGFVTVEYYNSTPMIQSGIGIKSLTPGDTVAGPGFSKIIATLEDKTQWVIYIISSSSSTQPSRPMFTKQGNNTYVGKPNFHGIIQLAKIPLDWTNTQEYDKLAGSYAMGATLSASVNRNAGAYTISWQKGGIANRPLLMFALPHHVQSMSPESRKRLTTIRLRTTTKGMAQGLIGDSMSLTEDRLPHDVHYRPWSQIGQARGCSLNRTTKDFIAKVARTEIQTGITKRLATEPSIYWAGKIMGGYASLVRATADFLQDRQLLDEGLKQLKTSLGVWISGRQPYPMVYESTWGGIITGWANRANDIRVDYGNALYNDHNFHYGYFVYTAAVIASLDPSWLNAENKAWVNSLIRDYANPVDDKYFPFSRSFDWYHGHSWATGLDNFADGKSEESSSEDAFSLFAIKLWGEATRDHETEARASLQLAILKRSISNYFLMEKNNINHPASFVPNKVVGILFENKVDHATWFGRNPEYIHGIHMLPMTPISGYIRSKDFDIEEWQQKTNPNTFRPKDKVWTGILRAMQANHDPHGSYKFFASSDFDNTLLQQGESRAYYLMYSAILAGF